jgi:hypothetical protein
MPSEVTLAAVSRAGYTGFRLLVRARYGRNILHKNGVLQDRADPPADYYLFASPIQTSVDISLPQPVLYSHAD